MDDADDTGEVDQSDEQGRREPALEVFNLSKLMPTFDFDYLDTFTVNLNLLPSVPTFTDLVPIIDFKSFITTPTLTQSLAKGLLPTVPNFTAMVPKIDLGPSLVSEKVFADFLRAPVLDLDLQARAFSRILEDLDLDLDLDDDVAVDDDVIDEVEVSGRLQGIPVAIETWLRARAVHPMVFLSYVGGTYGLLAAVVNPTPGSQLQQHVMSWSIILVLVILSAVPPKQS